MTSLLPTYCTLLQPSCFAYANHTVKHKNSWLINVAVCLEILQKQQNKSKLKHKAFMGHSEHGSQGFYTLL